MRIKLKYGSYEHQLEEASVSINRQSLFADTGVPYSSVTRWDIEGTLIASSQANLSTAITSLIAAYAVHGQDAQLLFDNNTQTSHVLLNSGTWGGVRVIRQPSFPKGDGGEYTVYRNFAVSLEAEERLTSVAGANILKWSEVVEVKGTGGQRRAVIEVLNGLPQEQITTTNSLVMATQRGQAVGLTAYPVAPSPLWPDAEQLSERTVGREAPKAYGTGASRTYREFAVAWSYSFLSAVPLALPAPTAQPDL